MTRPPERQWTEEEEDLLLDAEYLLEEGNIEAAESNYDKALGLYRQAMEIWLAELPSIPILQWYHRIPHNETYWKNWPSAANPYINSAYWHRVWLLVLLNLELIY